MQGRGWASSLRSWERKEQRTAEKLGRGKDRVVRDRAYAVRYGEVQVAVRLRVARGARVGVASRVAKTQKAMLSLRAGGQCSTSVLSSMLSWGPGIAYRDFTSSVLRDVFYCSCELCILKITVQILNSVLTMR